MIILVLISSRELVSMFANDSRLSLMLGDVAYNLKFKMVWNLMMSNAGLTTITIHILHYWYYRHGHFPLKTDKIDNNFNNLDMNSKIFIKLIQITIFKIFPIFSFPFFFVTLGMSCSIIDLITYGLIWSILVIPFALYVALTVILNALFFCLISLKLKLRLQSENLRLKCLLIKALPLIIIEREFIRIMTRMLIIQDEIKQANLFWSKWLLIQMTFFATLSSTFINQLLFNDNNLFMLIVLIFLLMVFFTYNFGVIIFCIKLHNEANNTYIYTRNIFNIKPRALRSMTLRIKV